MSPKYPEFNSPKYLLKHFHARNIFILSTILHFQPNSVYELSKLLEMDVSNLNKIILFFEEIGVLQVKKKKLKGREVKKPIVDYDQIEFDLKAA